jgi:hypothetical protein
MTFLIDLLKQYYWFSYSYHKLSLHRLLRMREKLPYRCPGNKRPSDTGYHRMVVGKLQQAKGAGDIFRLERSVRRQHFYLKFMNRDAGVLKAVRAAGCKI